MNNREYKLLERKDSETLMRYKTSLNVIHQKGLSPHDCVREEMCEFGNFFWIPVKLL